MEVRNGKIVRSFDGERGLNFTEQLTLSQIGDRVAYVIGRGGVMFSMGGGEGQARGRVVVDGIEQTTYDCLTLDALQFSAGGRNVGYRVNGLKPGGKSFVVLNGREGRHYDWVYNNTLFIRRRGEPQLHRKRWPTVGQGQHSGFRATAATRGVDSIN